MTPVAVYHIPDFHFDYYSIIPHRTKPQVLMLSDETGWSLPYFVPYEHHFGMVGHINQAIKAQLGLDLTVLRCFYNDRNRETKTGCRVYAMENRSPHWTLPTNGRWVEFQELDSLTLAIPKLRQILEAWFAELTSNNIPTLRVPWAIIGWFDQAAAWIHLQLNHLGLSATAPIEQVKNWGISCLLKVTTTAGNLYFKATPMTWTKECTKTHFLAQMYPSHLPELLAVNTEQQWMLMQDFSGLHLEKVADVTKWEEALRLFAQMQIEAVDQVAKLLNIGFPDRRIDRLVSQIEPLLADTKTLMPSSGPGLSETEIETLRSYAPQIKAMCCELANYGIPPTLVHGDFHPQNVVVTDERYVYFDWSDAAVAHPFFDAILFLQDIEQKLPNIPDVRVRLHNTYLEPWTVYMPMPRLMEAMKRCQPLTALYQAISYHEITRNLEDSARWETANGVPGYLKILLTQIKPAS